MLRRASSFTRRSGKGTKFLFRIQVHNVTFPEGTPIPDDAEVSVCFERGHKVSYSSDRNVAFLENGTVELFCYETLSLVTTIYHDSSGEYLEKTGKVKVRQKKKKSHLMSEGHSCLGFATLPLHEIAKCNQSEEKVLKLQHSPIPGAMIELVIIPKIITETHALFDEAGASCHSEFSDISMCEPVELYDVTSPKIKRNLVLTTEDVMNPISTPPTIHEHLTDVSSESQQLDHSLRNMDSSPSCNDNEKKLENTIAMIESKYAALLIEHENQAYLCKSQEKSIISLLGALQCKNAELCAANCTILNQSKELKILRTSCNCQERELDVLRADVIRNEEAVEVGVATVNEFMAKLDNQAALSETKSAEVSQLDTTLKALQLRFETSQRTLADAETKYSKLLQSVRADEMKNRDSKNIQNSSRGGVISLPFSRSSLISSSLLTSVILSPHFLFSSSSLLSSWPSLHVGLFVSSSLLMVAMKNIRLIDGPKTHDFQVHQETFLQ